MESSCGRNNSEGPYRFLPWHFLSFFFSIPQKEAELENSFSPPPSPRHPHIAVVPMFSITEVIVQAACGCCQSLPATGGCPSSS